MKLFIKKKKGNLREQGFSKQSVNRFGEVVEKNKVAMAAWLGKKTERFTTTQKRMGLIVFSTLFATLFIVMLGNSFRGTYMNYRNILLTAPRNVVHDPIQSPVTDSVYRKMLQMEEWLDSLKQTDSPKLKAILLSKPYLIENLQVLEQLYQIQSR